MNRSRTWLLAGALLLVLAGLGWLLRDTRSDAGHDHPRGRSITDTGIEWPSASKVWRTFTLQDYNTRVVFAGVTALGAVGGLVGTFLLLRKRSLLSDTVSHCTLPGIALAYLVAESAGYPGKSLPLLLTGAAVTGVLGMMAVSFIRTHSRVKDDAALAIVLSVFFGLGVALTVLIQQMPTGNAAGLKNYIYGKAAAMTQADAQLILVASLLVALVCGALFKELRLLCFDAEFARAQGWPVFLLDLALMGLVVAVTVIGLQAVGLLLVVALLIIPPAAARFWSHRLGRTMAVAMGIGAVSGLVGVAGSALFPKLPAGAVIVLAAVGCFGLSFVAGAERGLLVRWVEHHRVGRRVARQHLLRAVYEWCESRAGAALDQPVPLEELRAGNRWTPRRLRRLLRQGRREGLVACNDDRGSCHLTSQGRMEARRVTRNHRLWETYLLNYADVALQHIHHNADDIEHVIEPDIVNRLEELLAGRVGGTLVPADPELGKARPEGGPP